MYLISIEFQNIDNYLATQPQNFFLPSIVIILQFMQSLWLRFFLQTARIVRYKTLQLEVEKYHFILIFILHMNKYMFEA